MEPLEESNMNFNSWSLSLLWKRMAFTLLLLPSIADAFSVINKNSPKSIRPDATSAVEEALKITASFGIDSKEAQVAWDTVEELSASDNR